MICQENVKQLSGKRKSSSTLEEGNEENEVAASAAKMIKTAAELAVRESEAVVENLNFDKSVESEFRTLKSLIPRIAGKQEIGEVREGGIGVKRNLPNVEFSKARGFIIIREEPGVGGFISMLQKTLLSHKSFRK
jgi:hypothetical protein